jgi:rSAM/selenodomain-associated transferase 1
MGLVASRCVLLFTKPAVPGRVKTRLLGRLRPEQAASLQAAFFDDLRRRLERAGLRPRPVWALEPGQPIPERPAGGRRQEGADLGERIEAALLAAEGDAEIVAIVGSDHPDLPVERVGEAFEAIERGADLALGPTHDGGYYLIAARPARWPAGWLDGVAWSTSRALETTLERARAHELRVAQLEPHEDVDTPEDLERLVERLASRPRSECPRTRAVLERLEREGEVATCGS